MVVGRCFAESTDSGVLGGGRLDDLHASVFRKRSGLQASRLSMAGRVACRRAVARSATEVDSRAHTASRDDVWRHDEQGAGATGKRLVGRLHDGHPRQILPETGRHTERSIASPPVVAAACTTHRSAPRPAITRRATPDFRRKARPEQVGKSCSMPRAHGNPQKTPPRKRSYGQRDPCERQENE